MARFDPTDEQHTVIDLFEQGIHLAVEAGAGTGKTSTLSLVAESAPLKLVQYLAFNAAIVGDAKRSMPRNVSCSTAHGLAMRAVGNQFRHRLGADRVRSQELARRLGIGPLNVRYGEQTKVLQPAKLASLALRAVTSNFCNSADDEPGPQHVPWVDGIDGMGPGGRERVNNDRVAAHVAPYLARIWADMLNPDGQLPYCHDAYLKTWALSEPHIAADVILFDEAQDASPVMARLVREQMDHAQVVVVGDSNQSIYGWRGAVDALRTFDVQARAHLTESFRFGPEIAEQANLVLAALGAELRIVGRGQPGSVGAIGGDASAILTRTNAEALTWVIQLQLAGRKTHLVGGTGNQGRDLVSFVESAAVLGAPAKPGEEGPPTGQAWHRDLACFTSWAEVVQYVTDDPAGTELKLWVSLITEFGTHAILAALNGLVGEQQADVVVSTAHKAKGRQWPAVRLGGDFPDEDEAEDLRLLYVSVTRAQLALDHRAVPFYANLRLAKR